MLKGSKHTEKAIRKMSESKKGAKNTFYGKHHLEKTKLKISLSKKGKYHSKEHKRKLSEVNKGKHYSEETKLKIGLVHKDKPKSEGAKLKMSKARIAYLGSGKQKFKDTSIEIAIEQELIRRNIPYMKQVPIEGVALVDFLLPDRIIVQCDGDYWHSSKKAKSRDIAQDVVLGFHNYKIFRFTEMEIKKSPRKCINKICLKQ